MKRSTRFSLLLAGVCALLPVTGLLAQDPAAPSSTPSVAVPPGPSADAGAGQRGGKLAGNGAGKEKMKAAMATLTPDERKELMAARQKAMQDPAVQEARANKETDKKGFHRAMREAMLKADPNIKPIMQKMRGAMGEGAGHMKRKDLQTN